MHLIFNPVHYDPANKQKQGKGKHIFLIRGGGQTSSCHHQMHHPSLKAQKSSTQNCRNERIRWKGFQRNSLGQTVHILLILSSSACPSVFRTAGYITDKNNQTTTILAGRPSPPSWDHLSEQITHTLEATGEKTKVNTSTCHASHHQDEFKVLASGISFGHDQMVCPLVPVFYFHSNPSQ